MIDHKVLNLFNSLFISSVRIEVGEGWCCIYFKNSFRNHIVPLLFGIFYSFVGVSIVVKNWQYFKQHIGPLSSILRYGSITLFNIATNLLFLVMRKKCYILIEKLLRFDQCYSILMNMWSIKTEAKFTRIQFAFAVISYLTIMITNCASFILFEVGPYTKILIVCSIFIGLHFVLQQLYMVFFAEHLTMRYRLLRGIIQTDVGQKLLLETLKLYDQLGTMQKLISEAFGLHCVLCSLVVFLNSAIVFYGGMILSDEGAPLVVVLVETSSIVPTTVLFYGMTYTFNRLLLEEQEFKNAVQSLQYRAIEVQSEEYLNFVDQINLKLMTELPKITAWGLFTINLQVFNNVFAAIVTYIMILFQFRDFEKS